MSIRWETCAFNPWHGAASPSVEPVPEPDPMAPFDEAAKMAEYIWAHREPKENDE
jgi:hypothetical protein